MPRLRHVKIVHNRDPMQCIIHGDVKDPNILIDDQTGDVTMCDFQYTGQGPPTKDLAYFFCSSVDLETHSEEDLLLYYYHQLLEHLAEDVTPPSLEHVQASLELAYCDFCRFMCGWGHWGNSLQDRVKKVLHTLDGGKLLASEEAYDEAIRIHFW